MDALELLADLEGLRHKIPGFLQDDFERLIENIRQIYEMSIKYITPSPPVNDGYHQLTGHHATLSDRHLELSNSLAEFQTIYVGPGSMAYHTSASQSLQDLGLLRDHISFAAQSHQSMGNNFGTAEEAQIALGLLIIALIGTLGVLVFSGGTTAPVTVPLAVGESVGGGISIAAIVEALATVLATLEALATAALPYALTLGAVVVGSLILTGDSAQVTHSSATAIPLDWGNDPALNPWRGDIIAKLRAKGLTDAQIATALASAAAIVKALTCHGYTQQEINAIMVQFADLYDVSVKTPAKSSFWYTLAIYVKQASGLSLFPKLSLPNKIDPASVLGYQRVLRALIAPDGYDGNNTPVSPARVSGGPLNVAQYGSRVYEDASGTQALTQVEYDALPDEQKSLWKLVNGDVDIVTRDIPPKHIDVGGANKAEFAVLERQINRLKRLPGGESTAYYFLEAPAANSPASTFTNFETALRNARALLDPSHVIVIAAPTSSCTPIK